jgi:hypothetical protein
LFEKSSGSALGESIAQFAMEISRIDEKPAKRVNPRARIA